VAVRRLAACRAEAQAAKLAAVALPTRLPASLEADDDGRKLRRRAMLAHRLSRLRDRPVGNFAASVEPELQERSRW